jgi:preprotein translocase subunit SecE
MVYPLAKKLIMSYILVTWPPTGVFKILEFMQPTSQKKENPLQWLIRYVREARAEMLKVTWPSKQETTKYSIITIALALLIAAFFGGLDWLLNLGLEWLIFLTS